MFIWESILLFFYSLLFGVYVSKNYCNCCAIVVIVKWLNLNKFFFDNLIILLKYVDNDITETTFYEEWKQKVSVFRHFSIQNVNASSLSC